MAVGLRCTDAEMSSTSARQPSVSIVRPSRASPNMDCTAFRPRSQMAAASRSSASIGRSPRAAGRWAAAGEGACGRMGGVTATDAGDGAVVAAPAGATSSPRSTSIQASVT